MGSFGAAMYTNTYMILRGVGTGETGEAEAV